MEKPKWVEVWERYFFKLRPKEITNYTDEMNETLNPKPTDKEIVAAVRYLGRTWDQSTKGYPRIGAIIKAIKEVRPR